MLCSAAPCLLPCGANWEHEIRWVLFDLWAWVERFSNIYGLGCITECDYSIAMKQALWWHAGLTYG